MTTEGLPWGVRPMLATAGPLPQGDQWTYEVKWDGYRALVTLQPGAEVPVTVMTRAGNIVTGSYPELQTMADAIGIDVVLDGEIVAFDETGSPSFHRLQTRGGVSGRDAIMRAQTNPIVFVVFDVLHLAGMNTRELPLSHRRTVLDRLDGLDLAGATAWRRSAAYEDGVSLHAATKAANLEGVVAKRLDAPYANGVRSKSWIKVKHLSIDEFLIGGWVPGEGRRERSIGALLLGTPVSDEPGAPLTYTGKVGTGFTDAELDRLYGLLAPTRSDTSMFTVNTEEKTAIYVEPNYWCRVEYGEISPTQMLRFPSYKGLVIEHEEV